MNQSIIETALTDSETLLRVRAGETIFREGEVPRGVYVLQSGRVDLLFSARNGSTKPLRIAEAVWFSVLRILSNDVNAVYDDMRTLAAR